MGRRFPSLFYKFLSFLPLFTSTIIEGSNVAFEWEIWCRLSKQFQMMRNWWGRCLRGTCRRLTSWLANRELNSSGPTSPTALVLPPEWLSSAPLSLALENRTLHRLAPELLPSSRTLWTAHRKLYRFSMSRLCDDPHTLCEMDSAWLPFYNPTHSNLISNILNRPKVIDIEKEYL